MITIEEQEEMGVRRPSSRTYITPYSRSEITPSEREVMGQVVTAAGQMISHRQMSHLARSDDTAVTHAIASLIYSVAMGSAAALITAGILFIAYNFLGGEEGLYAIAWLVTWGICILLALLRNRHQGLWHSATGIAHHEIDSRERIAMHAIDRHIDLLEKRWKYTVE